jgi:hypothetical protein
MVGADQGLWSWEYVVADALSWRSHVSQLVVDSMPFELCEEFDKLNLRIVVNTEAMEMEVGSSLLQEIQRPTGRWEDRRDKAQHQGRKVAWFSEDDEGVLWYKGRICVPKVKELKDKILREAHESSYSIHPRGNKMYHDLKATYWWYGMKRDVAEYVALCNTCQWVKAEHEWPARLLQSLKVPKWKWEEIAMDFIVGLPRTQLGHDSIWVIVDRLTKVAHFIPVKTTYSGPQLAELYMLRIVCLHGVLKKIMSDRGTQFTLKFWERLHETLDTQLCFNSTYHPQTDGQTKRVNQILEDMLRAYALQYRRSWYKSLSYVEFSYNNSYQESLKMSPFEMLYGCRCQTLLFWSETGERKVFGPDILQEAEKQVRMVRENMRVV